MILKWLHRLASDYQTSKFSERNSGYDRTINFKKIFSYSVATRRNSLPYKARRSRKAASQNAKCRSWL